MQKYILIDGVKIKQPDKFEPNWATTYTDDSDRVMSGKAHLDPLFTVESYSAEFTELTKEEAKTLLQLTIPTPKKPTFKMQYYSWYYGEWRTAKFYVGQGSLSCKTLKENKEALHNISFDIIGVNPL